MPDDLPYVDEHAVRIAAPRDVVWPVLERHGKSLGLPRGNLLAKVLGTRPEAGFEITASVPGESLDLTGSHRFSNYCLRFELADAPGGSTQLRAQTYAAFPGLTGEIYRTLVIRSRLHVIATMYVLRSVERNCRPLPLR
ncbi:hypothetical protein GCM10009789_43230 [Kribbella sancticallisti]|uniref:Polyketide cyclase / dehydrase and lipid transport n=1 Tax=Kribbella sancticallisti TaxID=460087 RepID=A0ABN2DSA4_9ACTN